MYYKEFLRARKAIFVFTIAWAALFLLTSIVTFWLPMTSANGDSSAAGREPLAWPSLIGVAALVASIIATVLGSTLAQENDGHLELALTKSYSRDTYATTVIAVDMAAIIVAELVALAFIGLHIIIFHRATNYLVAGPDPFFNALHFMLFPLAWYAIIVGLSAGMRSAGIVQGLIWPLAIGLAAMRQIPASVVGQIWHVALVAINVFNPLIYVSYHESASNTTVQFGGASALPEVVSAMVLAAFIIAGYFAATLQWRRVEA